MRQTHGPKCARHMRGVVNSQQPPRSSFEIFSFVREMDSLGLITTANSSDQQEMALTPLRRRVGRPSLPPEERLKRKRASKKAWQARNWDYVKRQCAEIQRRPESKARRAELDKLRWIALKAVRAAAKLKNDQCVHSSDQFYLCEDKTPITTEQ